MFRLAMTGKMRLDRDVFRKYHLLQALSCEAWPREYVGKLYEVKEGLDVQEGARYTKRCS